MEGYANFSEMAILLTFFILATGCVYAVRKKLVNNCKNLLCFSAWIAFTCVMFLPAMHERYGFMAEILVVCYALVAKNVSSYIAAILVNGVAIVNYVGMMFAAIQTPYYLLMVINLTAYSLLTYLVLRQGIGQEKTLI